MSKKHFWREWVTGNWWEWWKDNPRQVDPDEVNRLLGQSGTTQIGYSRPGGDYRCQLITEDEVDYAEGRRKTRP